MGAFKSKSLWQPTASDGLVDGGNALIPKPDKRRVYSLRDSSGTGLGIFHCSGPPSLREANFLGGVASVKGIKGFDTEAAKTRFFEIYLDKYAKPDSGIGFPGALELISQCIVIEDALAGLQAAKAAQMRCIAVRTTLSDENLEPAGPTLIRDNIGSVSLDDILSGGSVGYNKRMQGSETLNNFAESSSTVLAGGLQGSRQDILRFGSLGIAISCLFFTISNWKLIAIQQAMQYASPKAVWNQFFGVTQPPLEQKEDNSRDDRIQQFENYISDLESRGNAQIVPEFPSKLEWLNTAPLQFLRFVVVGVHSAKFDNEKDSEAIRNAVLRYGISHPVVNDGDMYLWRKLGINSWPTFAFVGPNGKLLAQLAGEGHKKVYYCKEDEVCLYQSLLFEVPFEEGVSNPAKADVTLAHFVKPETSTSNFLLSVTP
ncbi:hypothetical protein JHK85_008542 [Glycine max]|nr:hypothetical protein JHK85_008542 [Glycine max]